MILNSQIWQATISEAKTLSANNPAILRAIARAMVEIERSAYWSFDGQTLRIKSTTSRKLYVVDEGHTCETQSKTCKHHIARRVLARCTCNLGAAAVEVETKRASMLIEAGKAVMVRRTVRG
jgi:cobalamin biosynthesis Mg chelatase CobN